MFKHALLALLGFSSVFASKRSDLETVQAYRPAAIDNGCAPEAAIFTLWLRSALPGRWAATTGFVVDTKPATFGHVLALFQLGDAFYSWDINFGVQSLGKLPGAPNMEALTRRAKQQYEGAYIATIENMHRGVEPVTIAKIPVGKGEEVKSVFDRMKSLIPCAIIRYRGKEMVTYVIGDYINVFSPSLGNQAGRLLKPGVAPQAIEIILASMFGGDGKFETIEGEMVEVSEASLTTEKPEAEDANA